MKKSILIAFLALVSVGAIMAQSASDLRIYINPGHGGWTADDRPCQLVNHPTAFSRTNTDTLSFFESNTDLEKGFGLMERLIDYGLKFDRTLNQTASAPKKGAARDLEQNIVMSRVKNGPYLADNASASQYVGKVPEEYYWYNRNLTDICEEVQVNDFDMFISIHSNAGGGLYDNYPLYLYRGYDDCRAATGNTSSLQTTSRAMAQACWDYGYENPHAYWSHFKTSKYIKGDLDFYGDNGVWSTRSDGTRVYGYLGALRHSVPGFLVEGYFHSYEPARHRAMNWDVCRVEGIAYAHGIADWFGLQKEDFGTIYGIVRDAEEQFSHSYYHPASASDDINLPLNDAVIILKQDGHEVARYITDDYFNGAFVFDRLEPGIYSLELKCDGYNSVTYPNIEVKAASIAYPKCYMRQVSEFRKAGMAYDLRCNLRNREITYSLSADVERAEILIAPLNDSNYDLEEDPSLMIVDGGVEAGSHTLSLPDALTGAFRWGVRVTSFANAKAGEIFSDPSGLSACRGGVVPLTDSRYDSFGYTLVAHGNNNGIDIYDPSGAKIAQRLWKGHNLWGAGSLTSSYDPCRGNQLRGKAVFASWGDNACGLTIVDPFQTNEPQSLYAGTLQPGGHYIANGINVGGGLSGFCFVGDGDNTLLYTFSEDHEGKNGAGATENSIVRYRLGEKWVIDFAPEVVGFKNLLSNTNVDMVRCGNGFFVAQNRAAGNNTVSYPAFAYIDAENDELTYNSGASMPSLSSCTTGIAVTDDGSILAVSDVSNINIYNVEWSGATPSLSFAYSIHTGSTQSWMNLRFDAAGNLHSYQTSAGGYHVYALKGSPAPKLFESPTTIVTGISDIERETENGFGNAPIYYDLTGRRVAAGSLCPGVYIKVVNGKSSKIFIGSRN